MSAPNQAEKESKTREHLRFVGRIYRMRTLGLGAGCVAVGGVLYQNEAGWPWWVVLAINGYIWPSIAYLVARRSRDPLAAERRNLLVDSMAGGMWIAVMQMNLLPSVLLAVMLSADKVGVGGWRFLTRTALGQAIVCALTWTLLGFPFRPDTTMFNILLSIPFMVVYPLALSTAAYALGRKVVRQNRILDRLIRIDPLTGLPNRRQWEEAAATEFARVVRSGRHATLLMLDIDHFKQINDEYGHPIGDQVLRQLAIALQASVRDIDTPGRFGGDEFGVVLTEATQDEAFDVAERIRNAIQAIGLPEVPGLKFSVSIGMAVAEPRLESVGEWIRRADMALYRAKREGRNRVAQSQPADAASATAGALVSGE